jgi:hypothetical protein
MFYLDSNNNKYYIGKPFSYNNINYSRYGATHEVFIGLGFTQVVIAPRPDDRFYSVTGPGLDGQYTAEERDLTELKNRFIREVKTIAFTLLKGTDWYIVRQQELGYSESPVPQAVTDFRAAVRALATSRCDAIDATTSVDELKTLLEDPAEFPETPDEVTTYG